MSCFARLSSCLSIYSLCVSLGLICFLAAPTAAYAQEPDESLLWRSVYPLNPAEVLNFDHLTSDDGLVSERIEAIAQDQQGFIWFGTWNGLYRYDGHTLKLYEHDPADPHSLAGNQVSVLHVDRAGKLWVGLNEVGLDRFDPVTEQFSHYAADPANPAESFNWRINAITEDEEGGIWFATFGQGLYRLAPATGQMRSFRHNSADQNSLASDNVLSLLFDRAGQLWAGTDRGLDRLEPATGQITHFFNNPADPQNLLSHLILSMAEDGAGDVWLAVYDVGLHRFDPRSGQLTRYEHDPANPDSISNDSIWKVYVDRAGTLWVGTNAGGLNRYEPATERFYSYQHDPFVPTSLLQGAVRDIFADRAGSLWLAMIGGGVAVWHPSKTPFGHYAAHPNPESQSGSLNDEAVKAIYQDRSGIIWLGTATGGLNRLDPATGQFTYYRHKPDDPDSLTGDSLYAIYEDSAGVLWVGGFTGLNRFDRTSGRVTRYQHNPADSHSLSANWVHAMTEDREGTLWVATSDGLNRFDRASGRFTAYQHDPEDPTSLSHSTVLSLYPAQDGRLWVGTGAGGLNAFDPATNRFTHYRHEPENPNSLSSDLISGIYQDDSGLVWLATRNGFNRLEPATGQITRYGRQDGLPADTVIGILADDQGYLWLSTFGGLSRFDPRSETFKNFDHTDGLNNLQYDFYAYYRAWDGRLWFGGAKGVDIIDPNRIIENPHAPPVVLTEVEINNRPVPIGAESGLPQAITTAEALTLFHEDRVVTFEFAALNFVNPQKNRYKYKLEEFDRDWVETTADRAFATYTNLDPGRYTFRVIAANNDGVWNEEGVSLRLTMTPAWWQTWWFRALAAAGVLAVFGVVYQVKANQVRTARIAAVAVRESEEKYRVLFESFPLGITVTDKAGNILETNSRAEPLLGVPQAEQQQRRIDGAEWHLLRPDGTPLPPEEYASVIALREQRRVENVEMGIAKPDGDITWLTVTAAPIPLEDYGVVISYGDVTPLKLMMDALHESEARLRESQQVAKVGHWAFDLTNGQAFWSEEMKAILGLELAQFMADPYQMIPLAVPPEERERAMQFAQGLLTGQPLRPAEFRLLQPDGTDRYVWVVPGEVTRDEQGQPLKVTGIIQDITKRKRAEQALQESEARYRGLFENSPISLWEEDFSQVKAYFDKLRAAGVTDWRAYFESHPEAVFHCAGLVKIVDVNQATLTLLKAGDKAELLASLAGVFSDSHLPVFRQELITLAEGGLHYESTDEIHHTLIGEPRFMAVRVTVAPGYEQSLGRVLVSLVDITARKQAEAQLRFQATLLDAVDQAVIATDPAGIITYFNQAAEELYGWPAAEALGRNIAEVTIPARSQAEGAEIMARLAAGQPWQGEFTVQRRDGRTFPALVYNSPILDAEGRLVGIIGISTDITAQKQREQEHVRQERLAAVGQLAAGIAHDFNNLLMTIMGNASLLQNRPEMPDSFKPRLANIIQQGERAARLTRQVLDFSRQTVQERQALDFKIYLNETLKFLARTIPETIELQFNYDREDYVINADPTQLQQVITNLAVNARDAMPRGGTLYFDLARFALTPDEVAPCPEMAAGEWIRLTVSDTGSGIAPEHLSRIFEPFFTTKEVGKGTGLGLAQIYGIVSQHEGHITVESQVGRGSTFSLFFPAAAAAVRPVTGPLNTSPVPLGQGETILLVEDDPSVLEVVEAMLETLNYRVLTVRNGLEAVGLFHVHAQQIALVLTDGLMPGMDGFELAATLRADVPHLKMILMSGYSEFSVQTKNGFVAQLQKPLELRPLAQALRDALA